MISAFLLFLSGLLCFYDSFHWWLIGLILFLISLPYIILKKRRLVFIFFFLGIASGIFIPTDIRYNFSAESGLPEKGFAHSELKITDFPELRPDGQYEVRSGNIKIVSTNASLLYRGETAEVLGSLNTRNFGGKVYGTLYAREIQVKKKGFPPFALVSKLRKWSSEKIMQVQNPDIRSLLFSMILGSTAFVGYSVSESFRMTGVTHLLAISGMNVALVSLSLVFLLRFFLKEKTAYIIASGVVLFYVALAGFGASILRAGIMFLVYNSLRASGKKPEFLDVVLFSAIPVLLFRPDFIQNPGFYLSYAAVIGIYFLTEIFQEFLAFLPKKIRDILSVTLAANIATLPVLLFYFQSLSLISPAANLAIIPVFDVLTCLLFIRFLITICGINWLGTLLDFLILPLWKFCAFVADWLSRLPGAFLKINSFGIEMLIISLTALLAIFIGIPFLKYRLRLMRLEKMAGLYRKEQRQQKSDKMQG